MMKIHILFTGIAVAALVGACDRPAEPPPPEAGLAPASVEALPPAPPAPVAEVAPDRAERYWIEAEEDDRYYDDRPPSYAYGYDDEFPAVWLEGEMIRRVVEQLAGGGERNYYYRRGQDEPYYVQDPYYGYGYDDGSLVTVYDVRRRRALDREATRRQAASAGRYLARSRELRQAALQADQRERRQFNREQWRDWSRREARRDEPDRIAAQAPPPVVVPPEDFDERRDRRDRGDWRDRADRGDRARRAQPPATVPTSPPDASLALAARREAARTARLKAEADHRAQLDAVQLKTGTDSRVAAEAARLKAQTERQARLEAVRLKAASERRVAVEAAAKARADAAQVARLKTQAERKAAQEAVRLKAAADRQAAGEARRAIRTPPPTPVVVPPQAKAPIVRAPAQDEVRIDRLKRVAAARAKAKAKADADQAARDKAAQP